VQPWHVPPAVSHTGATPLHSALVTQVTQVPVFGLHTGVVPPHIPTLVGEQTPQAPLGWQAGVLPPQSASLAQPRHAPSLGSQTGVAPAHWALVVHEQVPVLVLHIGLGPAQREVLVAEQTPQAPLGWQAGIPPPH
jgi:hypothetical protein